MQPRITNDIATDSRPGRFESWGAGTAYASDGKVIAKSFPDLSSETKVRSDDQDEVAMLPLFSRIKIHDESGVILARRQARIIVDRLDFPVSDRLTVVSAVTLVAFEALRLAGVVVVEFGLDGDDAPCLEVRVIDHPDPGFVPAQGVSRDVEAARIGMDRFVVASPDGGPTKVAFFRRLPGSILPLDDSLINRVIEELTATQPVSPITELLDQDRFLLDSLGERTQQEIELIRCHSEGEDSSQAIQSLQREVAEQAGSLQDVSDLKRRFLSRVSHELRTPLASILTLARLLRDRADGALTVEQERQVSFILREAHDLLGLINDLLDLARMESGRETLQISEVSVADLFAALREVYRPLVPPGSAVVLVFEDPTGLPPLWTDKAKLTEILRNFLSHALKFTETGEIRVKAAPRSDQSIEFSVIDTGLQIPSESLGQVFEEFSRLDTIPHPPDLGAALGLPFVRKLARALGGWVGFTSQPGTGSVFTAKIPIHPGDKAEQLGVISLGP